MRRPAIISVCAIVLVFPGIVTAETESFSILEDIALLKPADIAKMEASLPAKATVAPSRPRKLLIYCNAEGWFERSLVLGAKAVESMGRKTGAWESTLSDNPAQFEPDNLKQYDAIFLNQCSRDFFIPGFRKERRSIEDEGRHLRWLESEAKQANDEAKLKDLAAKREDFGRRRAALEAELAIQRKPWEVKDPVYKQAFVDFVKNGKGVAATSTAMCAHYRWKEYGAVMGAHGNAEFVTSSVARYDDPQHPLMAAFAGTPAFAYTGQIYAYLSRRPSEDARLRILMSVDLAASKIDLGTLNKGRNKNDRFPLTWINTYGQGRVFFNAYGPGNSTWQDPIILRHYLDGIQFALGDLKCDATPNENAPQSIAK